MLSTVVVLTASSERTSCSSSRTAATRSVPGLSTTTAVAPAFAAVGPPPLLPCCCRCTGLDAAVGVSVSGRGDFAAADGGACLGVVLGDNRTLGIPAWLLVRLGVCPGAPAAFPLLP